MSSLVGASTEIGDCSQTCK